MSAENVANATRVKSFMQSVPGFGSFPEVNYNFVVMAGLNLFGEFQSVREITHEHDPYELKEGGRNFSPRYRPFGGPSKRGQIKLTWGSVLFDSMQSWMDDVEIGVEFRRQVFILQLGRAGWPIRIMRCGGAWPISWSAPELDTSDTRWAVEEITLVYETFNSVKIPTSI